MNISEYLRKCQRRKGRKAIIMRPQYNAMYCERMNTDLPLRASYMPPWLLFPLPSQHQHGQHLDHLIFRLIFKLYIYHSNIHCTSS